MPTEAGPLTVEMIREALIRFHQRTGVQIFVGALDDTVADDLNSALTPILTERERLAAALAAEEMRERAVNWLSKYVLDVNCGEYEIQLHEVAEEMKIALMETEQP